MLEVEEGSLYPALQRLLLKGWVRAEWGVSDNNRRARFYAITRAGRKQLEDRPDAEPGEADARVLFEGLVASRQVGLRG